MSKVGISDVARAAGVSEATVSRVMNNRGVVASATRRAVEDAMRAVGYSKGSSNDLVLLVTPGLVDPFFALASERVSASLATLGMRTVVCSAPVGGTHELDFVSAMVDAGVLAVVLISASNTLEGADLGVPRLLAREGVPLVCIDGGFDGVSAPVLSTNDAMAAELAVAHLWDQGHRELALLAGPGGNRPSDRRAAGFREALVSRGVADDDVLVIHDAYSVEGGASAATAALAQRPGVTGLVAASDEMALGAIRAARRAGFNVPGQVSVVGYNDAYMLEFTDPPLTSVRQPVDRIAAAVAPLVLALTQGRRVDTTELLFDPELVVRSSTASA